MKNHLGEPTQTTFAGWKAATKRESLKLFGVLPTYEGSKDIASAFVTLQGSGKRIAIGEWDGAQGSQHKPSPPMNSRDRETLQRLGYQQDN